MSESARHDQEKAIAYVVRALQMDPVRYGEQIIDARSAALDLHAEVNPVLTSDVQQSRRTRQELQTALDRVRANFWTMPLDHLNYQLARFSAADFPDLRIPIARLQTAARHRESFVRLAECPGFDSMFFDALKKVLILAPRDVALIKEYLLLSFRRPIWRRRRRRMLDFLKHQAPAVYELETEWFDSLRRQKFALIPQASLRRATGAATPKTKIEPWIFWIILLFILNIVGLFVHRQ